MRLSTIIIFGIGALLGSFATYYYTEKKIEHILREKDENSQVENPKKVDTIEEVNEEEKEEERITKVKAKNVAELKLEKEKEREEILDLYKNLLEDHGYLYEYESMITNLEKVDINVNPRPPYVIPSGIAGTDDYINITIVYYADGVLADDNEDIIEDWPDLIGSMDVLSCFDDDRVSEVYVRNERLHLDIEILRDLATFSSIKKKYTWKEE